MVRLALQLLYRQRYIPPKWNHPLYGDHLARGRMPGLEKGKYPITRKKSYLEKGITLRDCVKVMTIHFGDYGDENHDGTRNVALLNFQQFQYQNPHVQIEFMENLTPTPFFTFFLDDGEKIIVDTDGKSQFEILKHINKVVGKPRKLLALETAAIEENPANFGCHSSRKCICMVEGQVPCSSSLPNTPGYYEQYRGKNRQQINFKQLLYGKE